MNPFPSSRVAFVRFFLWVGLGGWTVGNLAAANPNLVANPGFESGLGSWSAVGGNLQIVSPGFAGNSAMRSSNRTQTYMGVGQSLLGKMLPGRSYECSAWVRTSSATASNVQMTFEFRDAHSPSTSVFQGAANVSASNQWVQLRGVYAFDATPAVTLLNFKLEGPGSGTDIFVDEVVVREAEYPAPENVVVNSGFESGTASWQKEGAAVISTTPGNGTSLAGLATNRASSADGLAQLITGGVRAGKSYYGSAWVRTDHPAVESATLSVVATVDGTTTTVAMGNGPVNQAGWRFVSGYFTLVPGVAPSQVRLVIAGPAAGVNLAVDDVFFGEATGLRWAAKNFPKVRLGSAPSQSLVGAGGARDALLATQFQVVSPENALKFESTEPVQGTRAWSAANQYVRFAAAHGSGTRGHNFVWHSAIPAWVNPTSRTPAVLQSILWSHIDPLAAGFSGRVLRWDVVNEALSDSGGVLRGSPWYNAPGIGYAAEGDRYLREAFLRARAADPISPLVYNDYSVEAVNQKSTAMFNLLSAFKAASVPIDGVGLQSHLQGPGAFPYSSMADNIERLQNLGLEIEITEFDVRLPVDSGGHATTANLNAQADIAFAVLGTALASPKFVGFQVWNLTDADSWIPGTFPGEGAATLFDAKFDKKPAYWGVWNALAGQAEKLPVMGTSKGLVEKTHDDKTASGGGILQFSGTEVGSMVSLGVDVPFAGQWNIQYGHRRTNASGQYQLSVSAAGQASVNLGAAQDGYGAGDTVRDLGTMNFPNPGSYTFQFRATGKNASSTGYLLLLDYLRLTPLACAPTIDELPKVGVALGETVSPMRIFAEDDQAHGSLIVTAESSNPALVPAANLQISGYSPFFSLSATPVANVAGVTTITVSASDGTLVTTRSFTLRVGSLRDAWRQTNFGSAANTGDGADNADPDGDGLSNHLEFDLASAPRVFSPDALPVMANSPAGPTFTYTFQALVPGLTYLVQESGDLISWGPAIIGSSETLGDVGDAETVRLTFPSSAGSPKFYRLLITEER